ncbi:MAG: glycosyltransferase family 4 protein [Candidatus Dormibacteria bacterium]
MVVVSGDRVGLAMAGPAIRCWEMCRELSANGHQVHLASPAESDREAEGFELVVTSDRSLLAEIEWADVLVVQGVVTAVYPFLLKHDKRLVVDLYDPYNLEILELFHDHPFEERMGQHKGHLAALVNQLERGDFFLCASEKQRDYWLGALSSRDRINPYTHGSDPLLRRLIDTCSFGISETPPRPADHPVAKGVLPGIEADSRLVVWGGGVYNWFDPLSLIRAWPAILEREPRARLLFLGMKHPNPDVPEMAMALKAIRLAEDLGLKDTAIHFNTNWVPYDQRQAYLCEAEIGVSTHFEHVETAFSFRTRILDYIWAGLPVVATEGDEFARWIASQRTGRVVRFEDPGSIADGIGDLLADDEQYQAAAAAVRRAQPDYLWTRTLAPLGRYCANPEPAADLAASPPSSAQVAAIAELAGSARAPRGVGARAGYFLRTEGAIGLTRRMVRTARRRLSRAIAGGGAGQ